jgi:hypothetical protein
MAARFFQTAQAWLDGKDWMGIWRKQARHLLGKAGLLDARRRHWSG